MFQNKFIKFVFICGSMVFVQNTQAAAFLITPNVGYKNHTMKLTDLSDVTSEIKMTSPVFGLKLGFLTSGGIGFDISGAQSSGKAKITRLAVETENDFTHTTASAQLSVSALNTFKIFLGYILLNDFSLKSSTPGASSKLKGTGYQAGIAVNITQSIAIGAQYDIHQFNEINLESVGRFEDIKNYYKKIDSQSTTFNLSLSF